MSRIYPFRALRYDTSRVNMADVVTQPYDKITPEMQQRYYDQSPFNLIRIVLGRREPGDTEASNVYTRGAEAYHAWRAEGILREEATPALFGYSQTYTVPGTTEVRERKGFIALGHLYDYADHVVYRHEQTFPKHKSDRLALFKAIRAYPEQIYMLYADPSFTAEHLLFETTGGDPRPADLEITDEYNVLHRVWQVTDPLLIGQVVAMMSQKELIIADGHHRYETSVAYRHERAAELGLGTTGSEDVSAADPLTPPSFPEAAMMMTFVNMEDPGITILPTHRVLFGLPSFQGRQFAQAAEALCRVEPLPVATGGANAATALVQQLNQTEGIAFVAVTRDGSFLLQPKAEAVSAQLSSLSARQRSLDVVQLHKLILEQLLHLDEDTVRAGNHVRYLREADEAVRQVNAGEADVAFLIKPVTLEQMRDISLALEVMPQKSTDFYPKLLSGLAIYALD